MIIADLLTDELICVIAIVSFTFVGSCAKDYLLLVKYHVRMKVARVILSCITASIAMYLAAPIIIQELSFRGLIAMSFISGLSGFELLDRISSFKNMIGLLKFFIGVKDARDVEDMLTKKEIEEKTEEILRRNKSKDNNEKNN